MNDFEVCVDLVLKVVVFLGGMVMNVIVVELSELT